MSDDPFMAMADHLTKMIEISAGHRERAIASGFSKDAAEQMAVQVHGVLMEALMPGRKK